MQVLLKDPYLGECSNVHLTPDLPCPDCFDRFPAGDIRSLPNEKEKRVRNKAGKLCKDSRT